MTISAALADDDPTRTLVAEFKAQFPAAYRLAACASLAARVEPELLRALRLELLPGADAGAEADVWLGPFVAYRSAGSLQFDRDVCELLRQELALAENRSFLEAAHRIVARLHENMPSALKAEEDITWLALSGGETTSSQINAILQSLIATMAADSGRRLDIARWAAGGLQRLPAVAQSSDLARSVGFAAGTLLNRPQLLSALPGSGASWNTLAALLPSDLGEVSVGIQLVAGGVEITDPSAAEHELQAPRTTPVVLEVTWRREDTGWSQVVGWEPGQSRQVLVPSDVTDPTASITVRTLSGKVFSLRASGTPQPSMPPIPSRPTLQATQRPRATARALLVGINQYAHLPGLRGCSEGVAEIARFVQDELNWTDLRTLVDTQATADAIRRACIDLLSAGRGDEIWVYYAGHSTTPTVDGRPDLVLLASDAADVSDVNAPGQLHANELAQYLHRASIAGARVTLILDTVRAGPDANGNTWLPPETPSEELVVLAASQADQLAYAMALPSGGWTGALTDALIRTLLQLSPAEREHASWLHVYPMVRARVEALFPSQTPALIGRAERPVFSGDWTPDAAGHAVVQTLPGVYTLGINPQEKLRVGDTLEVTSGSAQAEAARRRSGFLEVTQVGFSVATARPAGRLFDIEPGARAYAVRGRAALMRVALVPPSASLQALLDASPLLRVVRADDPEAQVVVEGSPERGWVIRNATEPEVARIGAGQQGALLNALNAYWRYNTVLQQARRPALDFAQCGVTARFALGSLDDSPGIPVDPLSGEPAGPPDLAFVINLVEHMGSPAYITLMRCSPDGRVDQMVVTELSPSGSQAVVLQLWTAEGVRSGLHHVAIFVSRTPLPDLHPLETPAAAVGAQQPPAELTSTDLLGDSSGTWAATLVPLHVGEQYRWDLSGLLGAVIAQVGIGDAGVLLSIVGISFQLVPGEGKDALIRRLVLAATRMGTTGILVNSIRRLFPNVDVDAYRLGAAAKVQPPPSEASPIPAAQTEAPAPEPMSAVQAGALELLRSEDPLDASSAMKPLLDDPLLFETLMSLAGGVVSRATIRAILATQPESSSNAILERIAASGPTGESWQQARGAASLASPALRDYLEPQLAKLIGEGPEVSRHALTALGEIGAAGADAADVLKAMIPAYADKRLPFALDAAARSFELAAQEPDVFANADLMVRLDELRSSLLPSSANAAPTLRECDVQHVDAALKVFLPSSSSSVVHMGLSVIENVLDPRAAEAVLNVALTSSDEAARRRAMQTVWRLGDPQIIGAMRSRVEPTLALQGVEFGLEFLFDDREFDSLLPTALEHPQRFMALRAVGIRLLKNYVGLLHEELRGSDALSRGYAALALSQFGDAEAVRAAYVSAAEPAERVFAALAMLTVGGAEYPSIAFQLRQDLRSSVIGYLPELQADILSSLANVQHPEAAALGQAWAPFCYAAARRRSTLLRGPQAA